MKLDDILRKTALALASLFVAVGAGFAIGNVIQDPGGWIAVLVTAAIAVPLVALTVLAARTTSLASAVLTASVTLFIAWAVVLAFVRLPVPTIPVIAVVLALPIAVLGQRLAKRAGFLLLGEVVAPLLLVLVRYFTESDVEGPGLGSLLSTSTGVVVLPLAVLAALFLTAGWLYTPEVRAPEQPVEPNPAALTG